MPRMCTGLPAERSCSRGMICSSSQNRSALQDGGKDGLGSSCLTAAAHACDDLLQQPEQIRPARWEGVLGSVLLSGFSTCMRPRHDLLQQPEQLGNAAQGRLSQ